MKNIINKIKLVKLNKKYNKCIHMVVKMQNKIKQGIYSNNDVIEYINFKNELISLHNSMLELISDKEKLMLNIKFNSLLN